MSAPTRNQMLATLSETYGLTTSQIVEIFRTPIHPKTLRDEFATAAMQGLLTQSELQELTVNDIAAMSYQAADAMLKARTA